MQQPGEEPGGHPRGDGHADGRQRVETGHDEGGRTAAPSGKLPSTVKSGKFSTRNVM